MRIMVLFGSARVGRRGEKVAAWVARELAKQEGVEVDLVDPVTLNLPFYNEALSPDKSPNGYTNPNGKAWAERVEKADGFIFVVAEYNHGYTAILKNCLDWVYKEWNYKPASMISYSDGMLGGVRSVEQLKTVMVHLKLIVLSNTLYFSKIDEAFDEQGEPVDPDKSKYVAKVFNELLMMTQKLKQ